MTSLASKKNFEVMPLVKLNASRSRFAGEILLTDRTIRKHSVLKDVQGIGLDLLPEYHKSSVIDEKYKSVEDMEVILLSETILGHVKDQTGFLPAFVYQIVGLQPRGTKSKRLVECPYQILRDEALSFPYDTSFRRAALNVEFQPQFDVLDAPWILDQCLRYRQMLEMNDMMECRQRRSTGVTQVTHRYPVETRRESRYDVTTRRMEYSRVEPYSSSRRVRSFTAKSGPDSCFKDLLTGFYGTAFYGSGYCSTYGGYPLYGYNYIGKPYASIHGLYGDSHLSSSTTGSGGDGRQDSTLMTVTETTTSAFDRDKYRYPTLASLPPPPPYVPRARLSTQQSVTEVTTTTTTTTTENREEPPPEIPKTRTEIKEKTFEVRAPEQVRRTEVQEITYEVKEPEQKKRTEIKEKTFEVKEPEQKRWKTITEEIIETTVENEPKPKPEKEDPVPKVVKRVKAKPQQMVTICTYDSKQGANSDPLFQASTTRTVVKKESVPEVHHGSFTHSAPPPLDIEPVPPPPVVRNATHYYKVDDDEEGEVKTMKKQKTVPEVKVKRETTITTTKLPPPPRPEPKPISREDSNEDVAFEEYSTIFQPVLHKASSYPDLQPENKLEYQQTTERSQSLHHLSPQDSTETMEPEEEMNQSTDSITYVFVNRAQSLNSMTAEKGNKKNQLLRPVSEPDWEVINGRESRLEFPSKETSDTCIQTSGSLENLYLNEYSEESTTYLYKPPKKQSPIPPAEKPNVKVINITPKNHPPHKKVESEQHRPKEIRYIMYDDAPQHHRPPPQQVQNIVYKIIARDDEPEDDIPDTNHHIEIRKRSHHYRDSDVKEPTVPEEETILSIARAYLSDNMATVANHVQRVNGTDSIYYGENRVIVVDQQRQIGDKKNSGNAPRAELQIILPSRSRGKNLNNVNVGLRDRQISEIIDSYLKNRHLEKQETEGTEKNHKYQIVSDHSSTSAPDESSVFVIHDNGSTHDSNGSSRHTRTDGLDRTIYSRDKDGVEHGYRVGYTNDIHGAVNIYIHEVPRVVHEVPRVEVTKVKHQQQHLQPPHPSNVNHNVTIHVKHDKEEPIKRHVYHHLQERTRINDSMNTLDLSFSSSGEEEKPTKGWSDELEKLRLERLKILSLVGKESETSKLQMEATEANLNYLNGQTDSLLTTIDTDDLRPLPARPQRPNRPAEEVEYEYNIVKKHYNTREYTDPDAAIDDKLAELDLNQQQQQRNNAAAKHQLSRLNFTAPNLQLQNSMNMGTMEPMTDVRRHQRSLSSGIIDKLPILSPNRLSRTMTNSREFLPSRFPTSPTAAKKSWMNLNTNLFKASTAALQDAHRIIPTMGQYLNNGSVRTHNVMRRSSLKGANSPYYVRNGGLPRQRMGGNVPPPLMTGGGMIQDYGLESPSMSSVSTSPYFRYDEFAAPGNLHDLSRGVPQLNLNALRPNSQERLYFPTINPEFNYLDESGRLMPQATSGGGRYFPTTQETAITGTGHSIHCDHPSHAMQRLNSTYSPRKLRMSQEQIGHADCPICSNTNDVTNIMKNDTQADDNEIRHFSPTFDKFSNRYQTIFEPPRYDEISHSSSSRDSAFFSDPNALSGASHYFQDIHHTGQSGMPLHSLTRQPGYFSSVGDGGRQRSDHNVRVLSSRQMYK